MTQTQNATRLAFAGLILSILCGCASGPQLDKYPRTEIDRPYTLPKGVAAWHIPTIFGYVRDNSSSTFIPPIPVPLFWESSLSDDWNLLWVPLPIGVTHQFFQTTTDRLGIALAAGFSYGSVEGFRLQPSIALSYRRRLSPEMALDLNPKFTPDIPFAADRSFRWSTGLEAGPVFQLSDLFALKPSISLGATQGRAFTSNSNFGDITLQSETVFVFGCALEANWSIGRQWDFRPAYHYGGLGATTGLETHLGVLEFVHFW